MLAMLARRPLSAALPHRTPATAMLVLESAYYEAWSQIVDPVVRYWVRLWQDGVHSGTHPEWAFSPLSIPCLGELWHLFVRVPGEPDWGRSQRRAIRTLASRRPQFPDGVRFPTPSADDDATWELYWSGVAGAAPQFRGELFERVKALVCSGSPSSDYQDIDDSTATLAAEALGMGYSDLELFVRAGTGILDPRGQRTHPHVERVRGFLDYLSRGSRAEFLIVTEVLRSAEPLSRGMARRVAPRELSSLEDWEAGSGFVRFEGKTIAISRSSASHSITGFLQHRFETSEVLRSRSVQLGIAGLRLAESTQVYQLPRSPRPPWQHSLPRTTAFQYLPRPNPATEPAAFAGAIEAVQEDPEETIRLLCDAFERQLGADWPLSAGRAYRQRVRGGLARRLLIALQETRDRRNAGGPSPQWLEAVPFSGPVDFAEVAQAIRQSGLADDELLARRLDAVSRDDTTYRTPAWINAWLYLAKGVRNREVHAGTWPADFRRVAVFLARILLYVFVSSFPATAQAEASASGSSP